MASLSRLRWQLVLTATVGCLAALLKSCGGGGSGNFISIPPSLEDPNLGSSSAISGRVIDPFEQLSVGRSVFPTGSAVELLNLSPLGEILFPPLAVVPLDNNFRFTIPFSGSITDPVGQLVLVRSTQSTVLRGFVFSAAVDVTPWSEALYRIVLREQGQVIFANLTAAELRDLENILFTSVPLSTTTDSLEEIITDIIQSADQLRFNQLSFVEDLIRNCYAPEGNQSDQACRAAIPVPLPPPLPPRPHTPPTLTLTNRAFIRLSPVLTVFTNTVSVTVTSP